MKKELTLTVEEVGRHAQALAESPDHVVLIRGTAQHGKVSIAIKALLLIARERPGLYLIRMLSHRQTDAVARLADDPEVRGVMASLKKKRRLRVGDSTLLLDTLRSSTGEGPIAGAVVYCAEAFGRYAVQVSELIASTTGKVFFATWTDNRDMAWLGQYSPRCLVAHTHRSDYHQRMLALPGHLSGDDYENNSLTPSSYLEKARAEEKRREQPPRLKHAREILAKDPYLHIDPGFINFRKCASIFRLAAVQRIVERRVQMPRKHGVMLDHQLVELVLTFCKANEVGTLAEVLRKPKVGDIFCSIETMRGNSKVWREDRVRFPMLLPFRSERRVLAEFGTGHFVADTGQTEAGMKSKSAMIGEVARVSDREVTIYPVIMGRPTLDHGNNRTVGIDLSWEGPSWYQTPVELIDEFAACRGQPLPPPEEWEQVMRTLPEAAVKQAICKMLGERPVSDWGGELNDLFTAAIHLGGRRSTAAFVLKGPAGGRKFKKMTPSMLGKNGDQIFRLAQSPAQLLVVQHCHLVDEAVRSTLAAFAMNMAHPRRYCVIDGRDTYRLLKAYDLI